MKQQNMTKQQSKEFMPAEELIQRYGIQTVHDLEEAIKNVFANALQTLMEKEMDLHLGYPKHSQEPKCTNNRRNGSSNKTVQTTHGPVHLKIPRDREGQFVPALLPKHKRDVSSLEDRILSMYACGMSTRDIAQQLQSIYGVTMSAEKISLLTNVLLPTIMEWRNRPLEIWYPIVFIDCMFFKVKDNHKVQKRALYLVIGITPNGMKEVLGMWLEPSEHAKGWLDILNELRNRGVERVCFFCADGLKGLDQAIHAVFPSSYFQRCIVHQVRYTLRFVSYKDRKTMAREMKSIYQADTLEMAERNLELFSHNWQDKYPYSVKSWFDNWDHLSTFFQYGKELRRLIYTNNPIESVNRQIRKLTKTKGHFPTEESVIKLAYLGIEKASKKWTARMQHWDAILDQLLLEFEDVKNFIS